MRFNKLDLNMLVALDAMLTECSISRAAVRVNLSQGAMSNALARLREHFEDDLLVQVGRKMELTPRAAVLKEAVSDLLVRIDTTMAAQPVFDPTTTDRVFHLMVSDYTTTVFMPHLLALLHRQKATARFDLMPLVGEPGVALERGEADMLVVPVEYCSSAHPTDLLFEEEFCCVVWNESVHAAQGLSREAYLAGAHVSMAPLGVARPSLETLRLQRAGVERNVVLKTFGFITLPHLVVGTDLIATVHRRLAEDSVRSLPILILPSPFELPNLQQGLQWHKHRARDPALIWLRGLMHQTAKALNARHAPVAATPMARLAPGGR